MAPQGARVIVLRTCEQLEWRKNSSLVADLLKVRAAGDPQLSIQEKIPLEARDTARLTRKQLE